MADSFRSKLQRLYVELSSRALSILAVEITGLSALLFYLLVLPERELVTVLALFAFTGLIGSMVASNNTAKVYSGIAARSSRHSLPRTTLALLLFEQALCLIAAPLVISRGLDTLDTIPVWILVALAAVSSSASATAFVRNSEMDFLRYNYLRAGANLLRVGSVFLSTALGRPDLIGPIFLATLALPFFFSISVVMRNLHAEHSESKARILPLFREYCLGLPAAAARAFVTNGLLLAAVETLSENETRFLRLLLVPKDIAARVFNTVLPLVFEKLFLYRPKGSVVTVVLFGGVFLGSACYFATVIVVGADFGALVPYLILFTATLQIYLVLPFIWRTIHANRAIVSTGIVFLAAGITYVGFLIFPPTNVGGFLGLSAVYYVVWLFMVSVLVRFETTDESA